MDTGRWVPVLYVWKFLAIIFSRWSSGANIGGKRQRSKRRMWPPRRNSAPPTNAPLLHPFLPCSHPVPPAFGSNALGWTPPLCTGCRSCFKVGITSFTIHRFSSCSLNFSLSFGKIRCSICLSRSILSDTPTVLSVLYRKKFFWIPNSFLKDHVSFRPSRLCPEMGARKWAGVSGYDCPVWNVLF